MVGCCHANLLQTVSDRSSCRVNRLANLVRVTTLDWIVALSEDIDVLHQVAQQSSNNFPFTRFNILHFDQLDCLCAIDCVGQVD